MLLQILGSLQGLRTSTIAYAITALLLPISLTLAFILHNGNVASTRRKLRHLRNIGVPANHSHMADQFDPKYAIPEDTHTHTHTPPSGTRGPIRIKSIYIHPIKSCGFIEVDRALLTKTGFAYDRCFALAAETPDPETGTVSWKLISQRTKPNMCHIKTDIWLPREDAREHNEDPLVQAGGCVVVTFTDPDPPHWTQRIETLLRTRDPSAKPTLSFLVPLHPTPTLVDEYNIGLKTFGIHARDATGLDMSQIPSVATALLPKLKKFLAIPPNRGLTLTRCTPETLTRTTLNLAPVRHIGSPAVHGYTDQQPVNLNSLASVHAVSALLPPENRPLDALRFRANLWVTGAPAYAEETWKRYRIVPPAENANSREPRSRARANVSPKLSVVCRTSRCTMPNINLATATFDTSTPSAEKKKGKPQPSTTLIEHRTPESGNPKALGYLGMHCVPEDDDLDEAQRQGRGLYVHVGDEIEVLETGEHLYGSTANDY
ncbi:hypothetical protein CORC01_08857 [Colletotrichum orchidophilum]|uniref:MOSC domain-containing protein n=1 Tax=Colletotrichum orchidophilum TaxID=1209926 RepID=A0A1G4B370_9PEZI|nr:uncharacterized protein CORC01_08857 [Colletotrichum orchidophilum]OHE95860.1 hypothetical protein CORC01_08857 [Colletotrichum orchidophilum]